MPGNALFNTLFSVTLQDIVSSNVVKVFFELNIRFFLFFHYELRNKRYCLIVYPRNSGLYFCFVFDLMIEKRRNTQDAILSEKQLTTDHI